MARAAADRPGPGRHEARERAIGLLYEAEVKGTPVAELVDAMPVVPLPYAVEAALAVDADRERLDELINEHADGWRVNRMPSVDRAILRLAAWELTCRRDIPIGVVMDEAIELAKDYSTENSSRFINGLLSSLAESAAAGTDAS